MATQNVEIRRRAKFPSDFVLGGYLVAMDRVLNPLIPFLSHPAFFKSFLSDALQPDFSFGLNHL